MKNLGNLMKQAKEMQERVQAMQEQSVDIDFVGKSGGGMVLVTLNGQGEARKVEIDKELFNSNDAEVVEDLVVTAINDARRQVDQHMQSEMRRLTGEYASLPGMKLPF